MHATSGYVGTITPSSTSQGQKSLTIKHKQLAKAIKQHHNNMVRKTDS